MAKAVFTTKISPSYKDLPELMYHFPRTYLRQATAAIGDWILYYEPRREDSSPAGRAGRQCYFATAVEQEVAQMVAEETLDFNVQRPLIQQLIQRPFREVIFSRIVKEEYDMTCAMTGLSMKDERGRWEVEAAHIKPVKFNGPDSVRNGIALSRTFHWMFDYGLISVADNSEILVKEIVPDRVRQLINKDWRIRIPTNHNAVPHPEFLRFHREHWAFTS
ncbi:MAG: HNH endonuclease [Methanothrix sp.]|jgi:putative restriction endonuclease|nr:HNH endonuclease [Methanothrix sp.]